MVKSPGLRGPVLVALTIEAVSMPGKGKQTRTGSLGDVMQSIQAAMTVARSRAIALGIDPNFHEKTICISMYRKERLRKMVRAPG